MLIITRTYRLCNWNTWHVIRDHRQVFTRILGGEAEHSTHFITSTSQYITMWTDPFREERLKPLTHWCSSKANILTTVMYGRGIRSGYYDKHQSEDCFWLNKVWHIPVKSERAEGRGTFLKSTWTWKNPDLLAPVTTQFPKYTSSKIQSSPKCLEEGFFLTFRFDFLDKHIIFNCSFTDNQRRYQIRVSALADVWRIFSCAEQLSVKIVQCMVQFLQYLTHKGLQ